MKGGHYGHIKVLEKCNDIYATISAREKHLIILDDSKVSVFDDLKHDFGDNSIFIVRDICSIGFPRVVYHFINTTEHLSSPKIMENQRIKIIIFSMIVLRKLKWFVSNMLRI